MFNGLTAIFLFLTGMVLTVRTKGIQVIQFFPACKTVFTKRSKQGISLFSSLCTTLGATIGTGNIVGVVGAILIGGPGALLWVEVAAIFAMAVRYAENVQGVRFRRRDCSGAWFGGPFLYLKKAFPRCGAALSVLFSCACLVGGVAGIGSLIQSNSIYGAVKMVAGSAVSKTGIAIMITLPAALVLLGGRERIARACEKLVPPMALGYILLCACVLVCRWQCLGDVFRQIFSSAFCPAAVAGGAVGGLLKTFSVGIQRGLFSNEAGLGTAPIVAAAAEEVTPEMQGLAGIFAVFFDTMIVCTFTGLAYLTSGGVCGECADPASAVLEAFCRGLPFPPKLSAVLLTCFLTMFAFTTILGWFAYAQGCLRHLTSSRNWEKLYTVLYLCGVFAGAFIPASVAWAIAEMTNAFMVLPNLAALLRLQNRGLR